MMRVRVDHLCALLPASATEIQLTRLSYKTTICAKLVSRVSYSFQPYFSSENDRGGRKPVCNTLISFALPFSRDERPLPWGILFSFSPQTALPTNLTLRGTKHIFFILWQPIHHKLFSIASLRLSVNVLTDRAPRP